MKILGMETAVGKKPSALTPRIFTEFNQIFLELYGEFEKKKVYEYQTSNYESKGILRHGDFTLGKVRNWLAYHQLIEVHKLQEPDKKGKNKTIWQLGPTKLGKQAYEQGAVIEVEAHKKTQLGIGKMYPSFDALWRMCSVQAENDGVARTRREQWEWQFRDIFILKLASMKEDAAKAEAMNWVRKLIAESPRKGHRNKFNVKEPPRDWMHEEEHGTQQSLVEFWPKKYKPKPKPAPKETPSEEWNKHCIQKQQPKEDTAYIYISAQLHPHNAQNQLNENAKTFIPYFTQSNSINFADRLGSSSGSGGASYNANHITSHISHFIRGALRQGIKQKNIKVVWEKNAKVLYDQVKHKKIIPEEYYSQAINMEFVQAKLLKIADNDTTNIWRGLEDYDVNKYDRQENPDLLDYCIWTLEKAGKKRKEIISILEKSRLQGYKALFNSWTHETAWYLKQAEEALKVVLECVSKAQRREIMREQWFGDYGSAGGPWWHLDWIDHLICHETDKQKWAQLISKQYDIPDRVFEIIEQADSAMRSVDPNSLPVSKKGLGVKSLTETKAKLTEEVVTTVEDPVSDRPSARARAKCF